MRRSTTPPTRTGHYAQALIAIAALAGGGAVLWGAQQPQQQPQPPATFRSGVEAVSVSVVVTDADGNPVAGLTQDDFEIIENDVPRPITTFSAINVPVERTETAIAERDVIGNEGPPGRTWLIALDDMSAENALRSRHFLRDFIEKYFGPQDTAAVVLTTRGPSDSGQDFTTNPRLVLNAIDKFSGGDTDGGRMRERNFVGDFRALMSFLATLPGGRKTMIFVSENIPVDPYQVMTYRGGRLGRMFSAVDPEFIDAISYATRNSIAVYPIDPRGLTTTLSESGSFDTTALEERGNLQGLAELTGGFALVGSNNYAGAFERIIRESSTYYVLAFNSALEERDGRYVSLQVRVRKPGLQVRSTSGYVAPRGTPVAPKRPPSVLAAVWDAVASAVTTSGVPMRVYAAPFRGKSKTKEVTVAITLEMAANKLNLEQRDGAHRGEMEILFTVTDSKNRRYPIYRHRATVALKPDTYERISRSAMRVISELPLKDEGRYQIRASAGGALVAGSVIYDLEIPDFRDDLAMSGVALTSTQAQKTFTVTPHQRLDAGLPFAPTTAREFSQDDTVALYAEVYENRKKAHSITFMVELRDEKGTLLGTQTLERKSVEKPKEVSIHAFSPNLTLGEVPPGRYRLRVDVTSSLDKKIHLTRDIPFTVRQGQG
jgi:VWFA-related protein